MAEGKKSILIYADWIYKFDDLEDHEAGKLIKHFFRYVNDLNPEPPDRLTKLLFHDIKNTLKRDYIKKRLGKNHWNWKGGVSSENHLIRNSSHYKKWRKAVFIRDNFTCRHCGKRNVELNAHHIKPFSTYKELRTELSNGMTLCKACHKIEHYGRK